MAIAANRAVRWHDRLCCGAGGGRPLRQFRRSGLGHGLIQRRHGISFRRHRQRRDHFVRRCGLRLRRHGQWRHDLVRRRDDRPQRHRCLRDRGQRRPVDPQRRHGQRRDDLVRRRDDHPQRRHRQQRHCTEWWPRVLRRRRLRRDGVQYPNLGIRAPADRVIRRHDVQRHGAVRRHALCQLRRSGRRHNPVQRRR